ncbi:MAG: amidase [Deltaproteobacteria bacterium]|nr:amidase [Deltaproteobacteria bacterium]
MAAESLSDFSTARALIDALANKRISAVELTERSITRIEKLDTEVNAVVVRDFDRARRAAAEADRLLARGERRPLLGVPISVKESFDVAGLPTTWGIPGARDLSINEDAVAVRRLKDAGAIVLGKTNVPTMLADWQSFNPVYGVTSNPWDLSRTPGGSSGGAAAALAAGFVSLELGSDMNNSLRCPAACCGVFAHKPTYGLVPMRGFAPPGVPQLSVPARIDLAVVGPMARSASDLAVALEVIAGPDEPDAVAYRLALPAARHTDLKNFRVMVLGSHPLVPTSGAVRSAIDRMAANLARLGTRIGRASALLPDLSLVSQANAQLLMSLVNADLPDDSHKQMQAEAAALRSDDMSQWAVMLRAGVMRHADWIKLDRTRVAIAHQWREFFREWDVLLCPVMPTVALPHDHSNMDSRRIMIDGKEFPYVAQSMWASVATLTGLPATAMPIGQTDDGLPISVQIVGPYLEDRTTIGFAQLAEREFGGFIPPPAFVH